MLNSVVKKRFKLSFFTQIQLECIECTNLTIDSKTIICLSLIVIERKKLY